MRRIVRLSVLLSLVLGLVATGVIAVAAPSGATGSPTMSLRLLTKRIGIHDEARFRYHTHNLEPGSSVALQRKHDGPWFTVAQTSAGSGHFTVAASGFAGVYKYRARIVRNGSAEYTTGTKKVYVYDGVSMKAMCKGVLDGDCQHGRTSDGDGGHFNYVMATGVNEPSDPWSAMVSSGKTSCRSITFRYISDSPDSTTTYLQLRQHGHAKQKHQSSSAHVGTFTADLTGNAWGMSVEQDSSQVFMYFNGKASCYTANGKA